MAGLALILMLAFVTAVVGLVAVAAAAVRRGTDPQAPAVALAARRHESAVSLVAAIASLTAVAAVALFPGLVTPAVVWTSGFEPLPSAAGVTTFTSPFLGAVVFCLVRALGERFWPRPRGAVRTAVLARRTVTGLGGWRLVVLVVTLALGAGAIVVFGLTAAPDGRTIASPNLLDEHGTVVRSGAAGPYPGWPFGAPILVALGAVAVAALLALWVVTRRPPLALVPMEHDDEVRRTSAARLLAGVQLWTGAALGLMALVAAGTLRNAERPGAALAASLLGLVLAVGSLVIGATALPGHRSRDPRAANKPADRVAA